MEEKTIDLNSLIVVETLPKIRETLGVISEEIDKEIEYALALDCTEESKTEVKKARANLNKIKTELEERRKAVKEQIMTPYEQFQAIYDDLVKNKLVSADKVLKERIDTIEESQKEEKEKELLEFATEWVKYYALEAILEPKTFIPNITLTRSVKSLKEEIKGQIERVADEIAIIKQEQEYSSEIMVAYLANGFDYPKAKLEVINRHKEMEKFIMENFGDVVPEEESKVEEEITAPTEIKEEELIECTFTVNATKEQLIQIKNYLQEMGVKYE